MAIIICPTCHAQVDDANTYCAYCGARIEKAPEITEIITHPSMSAPENINVPPGVNTPPGVSAPPKKGMNIALLIVQIAVLVVAAGAIGFLIYLNIAAANKNAALAQQNDELTQTNTTLTSQLNEKTTALDKATDDLNQANSLISKKDGEIKSLTNEKANLKTDSDTYNQIISSLKGSGTSNSLVSVGSNIYSVKKGESKTIPVNWLKYDTDVYMGPVGDCISAEWSGYDVKIRGIKEGISQVQFSSDQRGTQHVFTVTVICY